MRRRLIAVGIVACVVVACTVFTEREGEPPPADAGEDVDASALADRSDTVDAPAVDAAVDAADAADADAKTDTGGSPCTGTHWFCDDFDRDGGIEPPTWGSTLITDGGSFAIGTLAMPKPPSPPNTMLVKAGTNEQASAFQYTPVAGAGLHCELDLLVENVGAAEAIFLILTLSTASAYYRVELHGPGAVSQYGSADGGTLPGLATNVSLPAGVWSHAIADIGFGPKARLKFVLNGTTVVAAPAADLSMLAATTSASVQVGVAVYDTLAGAGWQVRYDNVFCDLVPP